MLKKLEEHDPNLASLGGESAAVLVSPGLQGRIFCQLEGQLIHRLDLQRLENPSSEEFNNLGGNSLWPAPEGGAFAFNYLPDSDRWLVQEGIATAPARLVSCDRDEVRIAKTIRLKNRRGVDLEIEYSRSVRRVEPQADSLPPKARVIAYVSTDALEPLGESSADSVLMAPWSLEQFPGGDGVLAFCLVRDPGRSINFDFYGMPETSPSFGPDWFTLPLGGKAKFQIGIKVDHQPRLLGALDQVRSLLILRTTERQNGIYFNIADNDQPAGPLSAADLYSLFSGGELSFFELETIAPMQTRDGKVTKSQLVSKTVILQAALPDLKTLLHNRYGIDL